MATITVKNIPDDLYAGLKQAAVANHRSINSEVIVCVEQVLRSQRLPVDTVWPGPIDCENLTKDHPITDAEFDQAKRSGRP